MNKIILILVALELSFSSCSKKIIEIELSSKNPIEYIFNISRDSLFFIGYNHLKVDFMMVLDSLHKNMAPDKIEKLFLQPDNNMDLFLFPKYYLGYSRVYLRKNGDSIFYRASFYLHLEEIDSNQTKVTINTVDPEIIIGKKLLPSLPHLVRKDRTINVESTTIEEYEILLKLGDLINDTPPC
jgi:hypothetical protein